MADTVASRPHPTPRVRSKLPFDESKYSLDAEELDFFKSWTGIDNDEALKRHIISVQDEAYEVCVFATVEYNRLTA